MNKPQQSDFALGSTFSVAVIVTGTLYVSLLWGAQDERQPISWIFPVLGIAACRAAIMARRRVAAYTSWRREWEEAAGITPQASAQAGRNAPLPLRKRIDRTVGVVALWVIGAGWLVLHAGENIPAYPVVASGFALAHAWGLGLAVRRLARGARRAPSARTTASGGSGDVVSVCLPVPRGSPTVGQATAALPDYCRALLARHHDATLR
jgi:hypothetical protein